MNDTVTILGRLGSDPIIKEISGGVRVATFRLASTQSWYDSKNQAWTDTGTNWYTVSAFRQLAENAGTSLRSGDGVIVTGRLKLREWESGGKKGTSVDIDAEAIGHDLRWGRGAFIRTRSDAARTAAAEPEPVTDAVGDAADAYFGTASSAHAVEEGAVVDEATGEVSPADESELVTAGDQWT